MLEQLGGCSEDCADDTHRVSMCLKLSLRLTHITRRLTSFPSTRAASTHQASSGIHWITTSVCNPGIPNPGIPAVFAHLESRDWQHPNSGILRSQKFVENCTFWVLNDKNINSSHLINKIFYVQWSLLLAVHHNLYFDSHGHSLQFEYTFHRVQPTTSYAWNKSTRDTRIATNLQKPKPNPKTRSRYYKFLNPGC